ncbi:hypothetical protein [Hymenobacter sp. B1770]|uniref:hypothetical protein n=1 Tax=Hymenobacter sp. B1770 TaxID=1718788 RepID=UPI003CEFD9F3
MRTILERPSFPVRNASTPRPLFFPDCTPHWLRVTGLLGWLGATFPGWAQAPTPLHAFLQQHYDSTVVYHSGSSWYNAPNYIILAKDQDRVDAFTYMRWSS